MQFEIECDTCSQKIAYSEEYQGKEVDCPTCGVVQKLPFKNNSLGSSSQSHQITFKSSIWVNIYQVAGFIKILGGLLIIFVIFLREIDESDVLKFLSYWHGIGLFTSGGATLLFAHILELIEKGVFHLENIDKGS